MYSQKWHIKMSRNIKFALTFLNITFHHNKVHIYKHNIITNIGMRRGE